MEDRDENAPLDLSGGRGGFTGRKTYEKTGYYSNN